MIDAAIQFGVPALAVGLVSAALAWLLQRRKPGRHPVLTALIANLLLFLTVVLGVGFVVVRALMAIGAAGHVSVDGAAPAASIFVTGGMVVMLIPLAGLPAALLTAYCTRRPAED